MAILEKTGSDPQAKDQPTSQLGNKRLRRWWWCITWLLVLATVGGSFARRTLRDEGATRYPYHWTAHWVQAPFDCSTVCFRKEIEVAGPVRNAYLMIAADNGFSVDVNGSGVPGSFRTVGANQLIRLQSSFNMVGYANKSTLAYTFNIGSVLRPGRNVINIIAEAQTERPSLLAEGMITGASSIHLLTDSSWKCMPDREIDWYTQSSNREPNVDADWSQAMVTDSLPYPAVDGDISALETPAQGEFISMPRLAPNGSSSYRRRFWVAGSDGSGWVRVLTRLPFDVALNGITLSSNVYPMRRWVGLPMRRNGIDFAPRVVVGALPTYYPAVAQRYRSHTIFLVHVVQHGWNTLEVTTHTPSGLTASGTENMVEVDARITQGDSSVLTLRSGPDWEAWSDGQMIGRCIAVATPRGVDVFDTRSYRALPSRRLGPAFAASRAIDLTSRLAVLVVAVLVMCLLALLGRITPGRPVDALLNTVFVPAFVCICAALIQTSFEQTEQSIVLDAPRSCAIVLLAAGLAWLSAAVWILLVSRIRSNADQSDTSSDPTARGQWYAIAGLAAILAIAAAYYFHSLDYYGYLADEYVSLLAGRGIARHGVPLFEATGIIYTRSSLYHYLLGLVVGKSGDPNAYLVRGISSVWQLLTVALVFEFGRRLRSYRVGLVAALFVAFSPMMTFYAREVRFYTQEAFFLTLAGYFLWRSVEEPDKAKYRVLTCVAYSAAYLSQQLAIALLLPILLIIVLNRQVKEWFTGWTLVGIVGAVLVMVADYVAYIRWTQTPLPFVDADSVMLLGFHTDYLDAEIAMLLLGNERSHILVGALFVLGLVITLCWTIFGRRRTSVTGLQDSDVRADSTPMDAARSAGAFLYAVCIPLVAITALITPHPAERYSMHSFPLVALTSAWSVSIIVAGIRRFLVLQGGARSLDIATVIGAAIVVFALVCYRPITTWTNTHRAIVDGLTSATRYVRAAQQPGDKLDFFSPEAAMFDIGRCDYFYRLNSGSIYMYISKDGVVRERNSAAVFLNTTDKFIEAMSSHQRIWLEVPQWLTTPGVGYRQQFVGFLQANFALMYQSDGVQVWLWDKNLNHYNDTVYQSSTLGPGFADHP